MQTVVKVRTVAHLASRWLQQPLCFQPAQEPAHAARMQRRLTARTMQYVTRVPLRGADLPETARPYGRHRRLVPAMLHVLITGDRPRLLSAVMAMSS